jgi:hypothetical protein
LREAIEDCRTDFELDYLTLEGSRCDALAKQLVAMHFGLGEAAAMLAAPFTRLDSLKGSPLQL